MLSLKFLALCALVVAVVAEDASTTRKPVAQILAESNHNNLDGYDFQFKTSDGVSRDEQAHLITVGDHQGIGIKGTYSYIGSDGLEYVVNYTADEKGYRPELQTRPVGGSQ